MIGQKISLYRSIVSIVVTTGIKVKLYNYRNKEKKYPANPAYPVSTHFWVRLRLNGYIFRCYRSLRCVLHCDPTFHYEPTGSPLHAGLLTLIATAIKNIIISFYRFHRWSCLGTVAKLIDFTARYVCRETCCKGSMSFATTFFQPEALYTVCDKA